MDDTQPPIAISVNMTPEEAWAFLADLADEQGRFRSAFRENPRAALEEYGISVPHELADNMQLPSPRQLEDLARISGPTLEFGGRPPANPIFFATCLCLAVAFAAATRARDAGEAAASASAS